MDQKIKAEFQIFSILVLAAIGLTLLALLISLNGQPLTVIAQGPGQTPPPFSVSQETLDAFGLSPEDLEPLKTFDLETTILAPADNTAVSDGDTLEIVIQIKNNGPTNPATNILFTNSFLPSLENEGYDFSVTAYSDGEADPTFLLPGPLNVNDTAIITLTGEVQAECDTMAINTAQAYPFDSRADTSTGNNTATINLNVAGQYRCAYLPLVMRQPTPTPKPIVYSDDFSDEDSGWPQFNASSCDGEYSGDEYRVEVESNEDCYVPAPSDAQRTYGSFEVEARATNGDGSYAYGIYVNGKDGDNFYLFKIRPNDDCGWDFVRIKGGDSDTVRDGGCSSIKKGNDTNVLRVAHTSDGKISLYINNIDTPVGTYTDSSQLTYNNNGIYVEADDDSDVVVKFDNFTVYR